MLHTLISQVPRQNRAIVVPDGPELSYGDLARVVDALKQDIAALGAPQPVSIALPNGLEFVASFLAVTGSALTAAPLNPNYTQSEFEFYIEDMKSRLVIVPAGGNAAAAAAARKFGAAVAEIGFDGTKCALKVIDRGNLRAPSSAAAVAAPAVPRGDDVAFVLHTSGTTGRPKAVPLLHRNMLASVRNIVGTYKLSAADTSYLVMPLFHVHGLLAGLLSPLGSGGAVVVPPRFSASHFWPQFQRYGANWYTAVPTIHQILLKHEIPSPRPQIRFVRSCSSSLAPATFEELQTKLGAPVLEAYAMTEACHQMTSNCLPPDLRKPGTVGVGHGVEVVILDERDRVLPPNTRGEISARGPNVTPGYINNPKANAESFTKHTHYFRTGDEGYIDDDGMLVITGRLKELINRGGEKISPIELDSVMLSHPAVAEAVAFGAPDKLYGQQVNAVCVLRDNKSVTESELQQYMATKVAKHKVPTRIYFTKVMPKTATGKIQRRIIAQKFAKSDAKL